MSRLLRHDAGSGGCWGSGGLGAAAVGKLAPHAAAATPLRYDGCLEARKPPAELQGAFAFLVGPRW